MSWTIITADSPFVDLDAAITRRLETAAAQISKKPWREAKITETLQKNLNKIYKAYERFETQVQANEAATLNLGKGARFEVAAEAGITNLQAKYLGRVIAQAPSATALLDGSWSDSAITLSTAQFYEATTNDGRVLGAATVTIEGDRFEGEIGDSLGEVSNLPAGLTASLVKTSATTAELRLLNTATDHAASHSTDNITIEFSEDDFVSQSLLGKTGTTQLFGIRFYVLIVSEVNHHLDLDGTVMASAVKINLDSNHLYIGGHENHLQSGSMADVTSVDARGLQGSGMTVDFIGDASDSTYWAADADGLIVPGRGEDTLYLGSGTYTIEFATDAGAYGVDIIHGFDVGSGGDVLDFSDFLNVTRASGVADPINMDSYSAGEATWDSGEVLVIVGADLTTAADVASAMSLAFTTTARGKAVVITADIEGDASIWYLLNQSGATVITASELTKVATLVGMNNFAIDDYGLVAENFL